MIVIPVKEGENIERALKRFKRKFEKTGVIKELRDRQKFTKPSVIKREEMKKGDLRSGIATPGRLIEI
jgi:small subunit ribosomal protein S21